MAVFLLYARRLLRRPFTLVVAVVLPLVMVQAIVLQYDAATSFGVTLSVPDKTLHDLVTTELRKASVTYQDVPVADRSRATGVLLSIDGTADGIVGHPELLRASTTYSTPSSNNVLLAARMNGIVSTISDLAQNSASRPQLAATIARFEAEPAPVRSDTTVIGNPRNTVLVASFNMIVFIVLLLTMSTIMTFIRDKNTTTSQRILVATRSKLTYYAQLVSLFAAIGVAELLVMVAAMVWGFGIPLGLSAGRVVLLAAAFLLFTVFAIALGLLLVSRTTKESTGRLLVTTVTLPMAMLGGALWPLSIMPQWMQRVAEILPTTWLTELNGVLFSGFHYSAWTVARPLVLLVAVGGVLFLALGRVASEKV
jgi:linearmycin/streptolysin S transport system permease protein